MSGYARNERSSQTHRSWAPLTRLTPLVAIHLSALAILLWSEADWDARAAFALTWGLLNFFWLTLLRRPFVSGALSLGMIVILIVLSQFKHGVLMMTATFVDVMLVDRATFSFLIAFVPALAWKIALAAPIMAGVLLALWQLDPFRVRRSRAIVGFACWLLAVASLSVAVPLEREDEFLPHQYVSKFARSAAVAAIDISTRGVLEAAPAARDGLKLADVASCDTRRDLPHIVMVLDESSFDATRMPGVIVPERYRDRFRSSDGKLRSLVVEGAGGPTWFTEYNVLTGLSVRSYGRFAQSVTRLATGHVKRSFPEALRRCGYGTYSLYSWFGAFLGARAFQTAAGIEHFLDAPRLRAGPGDTDGFFYDHAIRIIAHEHRPVFVLAYLIANHFPWTYRHRPDLLADWVNTGNPAEIDEYLRRQEMSLHDFTQFKHRLAQEFPDQHFLLVRFGDHQPLFAKHYVEPALDPSAIAQRILDRDARYFTTYYALEGVNFEPAELASALDTLDAPYLPLVVLEAAGVPLDAAFAEQRKILQRCQGIFYLCAGGAEARRFNRLLIDAGLIEDF
ncbi:MAG: LTA synthase family protein [Alphaproteobacteria bacterium]|nr:MAG: LTA synthase family protein [Alphaproteobacteria bacterium]